MENNRKKKTKEVLNLLKPEMPGKKSPTGEVNPEDLADELLEGKSKKKKKKSPKDSGFVTGRESTTVTGAK